MQTILVPITLPDDMAKKAEAEGLLSSTALSAIVYEALRGKQETQMEEEYPPDYDMRFKGAVSPKLWKKGRILGDIVEPLDVVWEAEL